MRNNSWTNVVVACLLAAPIATLGTVIAPAQDAQPKVRHHRYKVVDVGTFGGPNGDVLLPPPSTRILNNVGMFVGAGETTEPDPFSPNCFNPDCLVEDGLLRFAGTSINIGTLKPGYSGLPISINDFGVAVGYSQNGEIDPLLRTGELKAALWKNGRVIDVGTLGGNGASANAINNRGQIFGGALNTTPDPDPFDPFFVPGATQVHAVLWEHGSIHDLGTLGGTDSVVYQANELGQAMGVSFTDNATHESTGLPTLHAFLWERGKMHDVGSLGGNESRGFGLNNRGEVVGFSLLAGDATEHPFVWRRGNLIDLGTLGGDNGRARAINDSGNVVGRADLPGSQAHHAFLWRHHEMKDLGTPHGNACSTGAKINLFDQVVGDSGECNIGGDPFLWENGDIVALSDLIVPGSGRVVFDAIDINDRGEIVSLCATPEGNFHVCLLLPTGEARPDLAQETSQQPLSDALPRAKYPQTGERSTSIRRGQAKTEVHRRALER